MSPSMALPIGLNAIAFLGVVLVAGFTVLQVLATAPIINALDAPSSHVKSRESYNGVVSWVTRDSVSIIDSMGVTRTIDIDDKTKIYRDESETSEQRYYDIRMLDHVRVEAMREDGLDRALVILDIR